jgi:Zn-dependent protease with chaperone function
MFWSTKNRQNSNFFSKHLVINLFQATQLKAYWSGSCFCLIDSSRQHSFGKPITHNTEPATQAKMIYNNLIYFLVVIFVLSTATVPDHPWLSPWVGLPLFGLVLFAFYRIAGNWFRRIAPGNSKAYFSIEKRLSIAAVLLFIAIIFTFDLKYYLQPLSFNGFVPVLADLAGLLLFLVLLSLIWLQSRPVYQDLFGRSYSPLAFVLSNIRANLPIVLPWLVLSLAFDLLAQLPFPGFQQLMDSAWGDLVLFLVFILFLTMFFPPLVRRMWNCTPMEDGEKRRQIEAFFRTQNFSADILYWPLFEGRVLTAGVMGIVPRFRYLLLTPALLAVLDREELESVLAHEIGHVKKFHLLLYVSLFIGFSVLAGALSRPLPLLLLNSDWFYRLLIWTGLSPDSLLAFLTAVPLLLMMVLYFRFLFGYFIRNFERQADLHVFAAQGSSFPLIRSFEKIAALSGNIRNQKSWHHFGIGERIDFLEKCEQDRSNIKRQDRKVQRSLALYFIVVVLLSWSLHGLDLSYSQQDYEARYGRVVVEQKLKKDPDSVQWLKLKASLLLADREEGEALAVYDRAVKLAPSDPEAANNMAWLLLTAEDASLRDPVRALQLAQVAARLSAKGFILDTLATALWANGLREEAIHTEIEAARLDPANSRYFRSQLERFQTESWQGGR